MISRLSSIFGSKTKAQEILFLLKDVKKVVRQGFYQEELPLPASFCEKNGLYLVKSKFKVLLADENAYSNKGIRIESVDERRGMYFVYFSKNEKEAWLASYYELIGDDRELGRMLGYPHCCVDFFCKRFSENNPNLQLPPTNPFTNLTNIDHDCVLLSHFPCNTECEESIKLAKKYLSVINAEDAQRALEMITSLQLFSK